MVAIPMINTGPMNKKTAVKVKKGMTPEELSNDMIRRSRSVTPRFPDNLFPDTRQRLPDKTYSRMNILPT
ncbi:uncharacterized protein OCT59_023274 [Rhizophagus irregularis]|uniref:uncharacterized protein n=1 Tax=Rhizophagus irregularis TaxID=588596 RepID=UPI00331810B2|nr:hypothetical protein OCT59_023274 [Rhizophagus irregularis]